MTNKRIGIIGCGNMGEALLSGISRTQDRSTTIMVSESDQKRREYIQSKYRMIVGIDNNELVKNSDVIIIAVKPKDVDTLLKCEVACGVSDKKLLISIAAGIATRHIEKIVGRDVPVVRAMPNMGAFIGEAISSVSAGTSADRDDMELSKRILSTIGDVIEIDERHVDAVTALSGSGPAYFFYLAESMIEVGKDLGLKEAVSSKLVLKTMLASARLLHVIERDPVVMRKKVTSKGGTTEAAFKIFESRGFKSIVKAAVVSAQKHSKKISSGGKDVRGR